MPEDAVEVQRPVDLLPICPYCMADPASISSRGPMQLGALQVVIIFCGNPQCRSIWNIQITGQAQASIISPFAVS